MLSLFNNQKGALPLLVLITIVGLISFFLVTSAVPFKDFLLSSIYPKSSSQASTPQIFVATNGSDTGGNGSIELPYRTVNKALSVAQPGYSIYFRAGTYPSFQVTKSGSSNMLIRLSAYNNEPVVIDANGANNGIHLNNVQFVEISNFEVKNAKGSWVGGIQLNGGGNNVIKNNKSHDNINSSNKYWQMGILSTNSSNNIFEGNEIYNNGYPGIRIESNNGIAVSGNKIIKNKVYNNTAGIGDSDGIQIFGPQNTNNIIKDNIVYGNADDGIDTWSSSGNTVEGNIVYNHKGPGNGNGFKFGGLTSGGNNIIKFNIAYGNKAHGFESNGNGGNVFYHNVAYNNGGYGFEDGWRTSGSLGCPGTPRCQTKLLNNIGYNNGKANLNAGPETKVSNNNIWFKDGASGYVSYKYGAVTGLANFRAASGGLDANSLEVNPKFINATAADFNIASNSPAVDKATSLNPQIVTTCGNSPDIGRFENCLVSPNPTTTSSPSTLPIDSSTPIPTSAPTATPLAHVLPDAPIINKNINCISNNYSGGGVNISWTNPVNNPVSWVGVSTSPTFVSYYHKNVLGSSNTTLPNGFSLSNGSLNFMLSPNITYYVRLYNGAPADSLSRFSPLASFSIPTCSSTVKVKAAGTKGKNGAYSNMKLVVNGVNVKTIGVTNILQEYIYTHPTKITTEQIKIEFSDDDGPRDLTVEGVTVDETYYPTNNKSVYYWSPECRISLFNTPGYKTLWCNGTLTYR